MTVVNKEAKILDLCKNKSVLDVGAIGQENNYKNPNWLHAKIKNSAKSIVGVDIIQDEIDKLKEHDYHFINWNTLKQLKSKFEVIVMADIIEHVGNPQELLQQYIPFMEDDGIIVITTPNSNRARNFLSILFFNKYGMNPEHTMWFCPKTMTELINRTRLQAYEFFWLSEYNSKSKISFSKYILLKIEKLFAFFRKDFSPAFMFIVSKK
ncbi:MAG: methyltransferase domain-containing protein [Bacteroidetes bacterium]|nr:methyltransferase domain-containing protein [Bacteroidota bacterium]MBT5528264.1 methyltransferase domain-containing protein [Cytophagia bacterium]MBT4339049.1 methyltransferase domain-containing protein [Bacteroidota bacterium]MBT4730162.1 methyltransferase domain-containing protein [Bacteroidota bacterium]MBT4967609.1 methyltransferase domain-containing protein [Bacteroidota bacterium]